MGFRDDRLPRFALYPADRAGRFRHSFQHRFKVGYQQRIARYASHARQQVPHFEMCVSCFRNGEGRYRQCVQPNAAANAKIANALRAFRMPAFTYSLVRSRPMKRVKNWAA